MIYIVPGSDAYDELNAQPMVAFRNLLAEGTVTDALLPSGAPRADAVTEDTSEYWQPASAPETLRSTLAGAETADVCFIAAHTLGTAGASLAVQYFDGAIWQTITTVTPTDNQPFLVVFPSQSASAFGISLTGAVAQVGVAWIGPRLVIPGGVSPDYTPVWAAHRVEKFPAETRRGHFRGQRIERSGASLSAQFMPVSHEFALDDMRDFRAHFNDGNAFVWAPAPGVFAEDAAYCWADSGQILSQSIMAGGHNVSLSLAMEAYVER